MYKIAILGCENSHANAFLDFLIKEKMFEDIKNNELTILELDKSYIRSFSYILPKDINIAPILTI